MRKLQTCTASHTPSSTLITVQLLQGQVPCPKVFLHSHKAVPAALVWQCSLYPPHLQPPPHLNWYHSFHHGAPTCCTLCQLGTLTFPRCASSATEKNHGVTSCPHPSSCPHPCHVTLTWSACCQTSRTSLISYSLLFSLATALWIDAPCPCDLSYVPCAHLS